MPQPTPSSILIHRGRFEGEEHRTWYSVNGGERVYVTDFDVEGGSMTIDALIGDTITVGTLFVDSHFGEEMREFFLLLGVQHTPADLVQTAEGTEFWLTFTMRADTTEGTLEFYP